MLLYIAIGLALFLLVAFIRADGDLTLMWKEKFGLKIDSLSGQVVWITGASSGIGESIAFICAQAGCKMVLSARRVEELERVKATCLKINGLTGKTKLQDDDILVLPLDVVDFKSHAPAVQKVMEYFNKIDILINNAGVSQFARWIDVDLDTDRKLFETNVLGPVSLTQCVLPHMITRKKGRVCVVSSLSGKAGVPSMRSYTCSKHAVHGHFECFRAEMAEHNIEVTMICPGPVFSNLYLTAVTGKPDVVLGRKMDPTDKRMSSERCAYLSCVAIANGLYETWISQHPALLFVYISQYLPDFGKWFLLKFGVKRSVAIRKGK